MDVEYGFTGSLGREPNYELYDELNGVKIYISLHDGVLTHVRILAAGPFRLIMPAYALTGSIAVLFATDKHAAAAIAFIFLAGLPIVRRMYKSKITDLINKIAINKNDEYTPTLRTMAGYFFRF